MMQPELSQLPWQCLHNFDSSCDETGFYGIDIGQMSCDLSPPFTIIDESIDIFPVPHSPTMFSDEFIMNFPVDELPVALQEENVLRKTFYTETNGALSSEVEEIYGCLEESEGSFPSNQRSLEGEHEYGLSEFMKSSETFMDKTSVHPSLTLPAEEMEIDNQVLVKAYGEAVENEQTELADVIMKCISEKVSPVGEIGERLLYYPFQPSDNKELIYLKQEALKNFSAAFKVVYQKFPHGRIAHFRANTAILEAIPYDANAIRIIDFDIGEGIQWSMVIEAIGQQQQAALQQNHHHHHQQCLVNQENHHQQCLVYQEKVLTLTSIKWKEEDYGYASHHPWRFEETRRRLCDHATSFGLKLNVEEMELQDLVSEIKKSNNRDERKEWLVFNCMVGLPHMGRVRNRRQVMEFLTVAKDLLQNSASCNNTSNSGIITLGDGDVWGKLKTCSGFGSFFDGYLSHYHALLESMERNFPTHLVEARMAMECLFVAPYISHTALFQKWEEVIEGCDIESRLGLRGWRVSQESLIEAQEMVREGESHYRVRVEGETHHELVLDWRGVPLIRVSSWIL